MRVYLQIKYLLEFTCILFIFSFVFVPFILNSASDTQTKTEKFSRLSLGFTSSYSFGLLPLLHNFSVAIKRNGFVH